MQANDQTILDAFEDYKILALEALEQMPVGRYSSLKLKSPVLQNTTGNAVATPTDKRGFVTPKFKACTPFVQPMVAGGMGFFARKAARRYPCFEHPTHPPCFKTWRVVFKSRNGAKTMAHIAALVRQHAPTPTATPEEIRLHGLASNALSMALSLISKVDATPAQIHQATARAIRAATLLKRLSAMNGGAA